MAVILPLVVNVRTEKEGVKAMFNAYDGLDRPNDDTDDGAARVGAEEREERLLPPPFSGLLELDG